MTAATCEPTTQWGLAFFDVAVPATHLSEVLSKPSALQAAMELGRLDFISSMLAIFGLFLAVAALLSFGFILGSVRRKAKDETKAYLEVNLSAVCLPHVEKYLERNLSTVITMVGAAKGANGDIGPDWGDAVDPDSGASK